MSDDNGVRFFRLESEEGAAPLDGVRMRAVFGGGGSFSLIELQPNAEFPRHSHPHEQIGIVLRGMQMLEVEGVKHWLKPFDAYVLPGGVEHSGAGGPEGCMSMDLFVPVRDDYRYASAETVEPDTFADPS